MTADGTKIAVVGAGRVGSTLAYTLASSGVAREIVVIDANRERAEGEAMDIAHAVPFYAPVSVKPGGLADAAGAAVTVIAAGAAQREGESRPALLVRNVEVLRGIVTEVVRANPEGLLLIATNRQVRFETPFRTRVFDAGQRVAWSSLHTGRAIQRRSLMSAFIAWFETLGKGDVARVGGKNTSRG